MEKPKHFLSESAKWKSKSEFMDAEGNAVMFFGESRIKVSGKSISNKSWAMAGEKMIENDYAITPLSDTRFQSISQNPTLGIQKGYFDINGDTLFSRFFIEGSLMAGFEVIHREGDICYSEGALYNGDDLINTWKAKMTKE